MNEQQQDLNSTVEKLLARMNQMQTEIDSLKQRASALPQPVEKPASSKITSTRRKTLKQMGLALLGGVTAAGMMGVTTSVQAKIIANPQSNGLAGKVGLIVLPQGAPDPINSSTVPNNTYGLVVTSYKTTALDLSSALLNTSTGVTSFGIIGVYGEGTATGVLGISSDSPGVAGSSDTGDGVNGGSTYGFGVHGFSPNVGVCGEGRVGGVFVGASGIVYGSAPSTTTIGVLANVGNQINLARLPTNFTVGMYGDAPDADNSYAGYFVGNVNVTNNFNADTVSSSVKAFKIDHPLDPANKYLYHTSVESPDMKNVYDGIVTLDNQGEATVEMPDWFEVLNSNFRYQLTCLGEYSQVYIAEELTNRLFKIAGGSAGQKVSWQITGIRQDAYAKAHRSPVEQEKAGNEKGKYVHPELFGQPEEMSVHPIPKAAGK